MTSDQYYTMIHSNRGNGSIDTTKTMKFSVSKLCPNADGTAPNYQLCWILFGRPDIKTLFLDGKGSSCPGILCTTPQTRVLGKKWKDILDRDWVCDNYKATVINETESVISCDVNLEEYCTTTDIKIKAEVPCDGICDSAICFDEAYCNGYMYGVMCRKGKTNAYVKPAKICDSVIDCDGAEDEFMCLDDVMNLKSDTQQCPAFTAVSLCPGSAWIPIYNFTRCAALQKLPFCSTYRLDEFLKTFNYYVPMCINFLDQTNCTDEKRGVLTCPVNGFTTSLSDAIVCSSNLKERLLFPMCDDGFDLQCKDSSVTCRVHKHQLCNEQFDCLDQSDEHAVECSEITENTCIRRSYNKDGKPTRLPISWLNDGLDDCKNGEDEKDLWPGLTCIVGGSFRYLPYGGVCENVFLCGVGSTEFVKIEDLCIGLNTCAVETSVCETTRPFKVVISKAYEHHKTFFKIITGPLKKFVSYCLPGVSISIGNLISKCSHEIFEFPEDGIIGATEPIFIVLPKNRHDCSSFYGEQYVLMACENRCLDSFCPLNILKPNACAGDYRDTRIFSITRSGSSLTFLIPQKKYQTGEEVMQNKLYQCKNDHCVTYDKVCNLVNDCGDSSDEQNCTSVFSCESSNEFIPSSEKCNGRVQCGDYSDECREDCGKEIISGMPLKVLSWVIGMTAVILNIAKFIGNIELLVRDKTFNTIINTSFGLLINVGDFLTGSYLLSIAIVDTMVYGRGYCKQQYIWLSSGLCSFLGVISTFGTQISLFSMTVLSIYRLSEFLDFKGGNLRHFSIKIGAIITTNIVLSLTMAIGPIISSYEDLFVNGMTYNPKIKSFLPYVDKETHLGIIKSYYGRMKMDRQFTWKRVNSLVDEMFTKHYDIGTLDRRKIHFYGNDGVCLFKYFVDKKDPQNGFVWSCLGVNLFCFFIISFCYGIINAKSKSSTRNVEQPYQANERITNAKKKKQLQRNIAVIILTDFLCWVPFIFICGLHSLEFINAASTYPIFSLLILPINSVINPLLYGDFLEKHIIERMKRIKLRLQNAVGIHAVPNEEIEMELLVTQNRRIPQDSPHPQLTILTHWYDEISMM